MKGYRADVLKPASMSGNERTAAACDKQGLHPAESRVRFDLLMTASMNGIPQYLQRVPSAAVDRQNVVLGTINFAAAALDRIRHRSLS
jgi:hypothetical protein